MIIERDKILADEQLFEYIAGVKPGQLSGDQLAAVERTINSSANLIIQGGAGTGKSYVLSVIKRILEKLDETFAVTAPTGIAAVNVNGQTIHSLFRAPPRLLDAPNEKLKELEVLGRLTTLVIDEISMVRADLLDLMDRQLRYSRDCDEPFGGVRLIVFGDAMQLPPVVRPPEYDFFRQRYGTAWWFGAPGYAQTHSDWEHLGLNEIFRQQDEAYVELLHRIRHGRELGAVVDHLNRHCHRSLSSADGVLVLTPTRRAAQTINQRRMASLDGEAITYEGLADGAFGRAEDNLPAPLFLNLKVGAKVLITKNIAGAVNGTRGTVKSLGDEVITVERLEDGREIEVGRASWESYAYRWNARANQINHDRTGRYTQFPLTHGWAITIHKAQGLTLDSACVDMGQGAFAPGQAYVSLSRCRRLADLSIRRPLEPRDIQVSKHAQRWLEAHYSDA